MNAINATLTAKTPLSFRKGRDLAQAQTFDYVPGNAVLGALAEAYQASGGTANQFVDFFISGAVQYANLYPANFKSTVLQNHDSPVSPLPLSARSCKRLSGFRFDSAAEREEYHGVTDALIHLLLFSLGEQKNHEVLETVAYCPSCSTPSHPVPLTHLAGYYRRGASVEQIGRSETTDNHGLRTRTGINYDTRTAEHGVFYSREMLLEECKFFGVCRVADAISSSWQTFVHDVSKKEQIRVGNNRTRGFGLVELCVQSATPETSAMLETRVRKFNARLKEKAGDYSITLNHQLYIPLTLTSDAIVYDNLLRPRLNLDYAFLSKQFGLPDGEIVLPLISSRRVASWSNVWRMPKPDDLAMTMGSVFVLAFKDGSPPIFDQLLKLQNEGIGSRRSEGFGQLRVANEFHYEHFEVEGGFR